MIAALGGNVRPLREVEPAVRVEVVDGGRDLLRIDERLRRSCPSLADPGPGRDLEFAAGQDVIDANRYLPDAWPDVGRRAPVPCPTHVAAYCIQHHQGRLNLKRFNLHFLSRRLPGK